MLSIRSFATFIKEFIYIESTCRFLHTRVMKNLIHKQAVFRSYTHLEKCQAKDITIDINDTDADDPNIHQREKLYMQSLKLSINYKEDIEGRTRSHINCLTSFKFYTLNHFK